MMRLKGGMRVKIFVQAFLVYVLQSPFSFAHANPATVQDLLNHPDAFSENQQVEVQCFLGRESTAWLHLIHQPAKYMGVFVFDKKESFILSEKEVFPYVFIPRSFRNQIRSFRKGDLLVVSGKCFKHKAVGKEAVGIIVERISTPDETQGQTAETASAQEKWSGGFNPSKSVVQNEALTSPSESGEAGSSARTYSIHIGENTLSGLHFNEKYTLNGVEFVVMDDQNKKEGVGQ